MGHNWVDRADYFGPDRRRDGGKRWNDRRKLDEARELPPLGALLRRVRVQLTDASSQPGRRHALQLLSAAIGEAQRQHLSGCAGALQDADRVLRAGGPGALNAADTKVVEAMNLLAVERQPA